MSGVDVLAELERRIAISRELCVARDITDTPPGLADLVEARAAVAELIEAATAARDALAAAIRAAWEGGDADVSENIVIKKIDAALVRCRGGVA